MGKLVRIDAELVRRHLARSRKEAAELIQQGRVKVDGQTVVKSSRQINSAQAVLVDTTDRVEYASRGAFKLLGALDYLGDEGPRIDGIRDLDAGASTGGFTDVLLKCGASEVIAVDVGYGQLLWRLREDPRVHVMERTNIRYLEPTMVEPLPSLVVGDLSFISLTLVLPALVRCSAPSAQFLLMVKPQFEIGKERLREGGVVRNPQDHVETVLKVAHSAQQNDLGICAVAPSPLPGPKGNVEYFLYMKKLHGLDETTINEGKREVPRKHAFLTDDALTSAVERAVSDGPAGVKHV